MSVQRQQKIPWRSGVHWIEWPMGKEARDEARIYCDQSQGIVETSERRLARASSPQKPEAIFKYFAIVSLFVLNAEPTTYHGSYSHRKYTSHTRYCKNDERTTSLTKLLIPRVTDQGLQKLWSRATNRETQASANVIGCGTSVAKTCIHDNLSPTIYQPHKWFIAF